MANLTYHYCEFELMKEYHRLEIKIIRDPSRFHDAAVERNHHRRATRRLRDEYKSSARYHQEHDDPAFPVVNKRGAPLLPSLASLDEPFCQPTTQPFRRGPDYAVVPALIIDKHGLELPPSLVFRDRPTYEPETPETLRAAELLRKQKLQNRKTVKIAEGYRTYIQPTYIDGVPGHTLEILDDEPHPTRETARAKKSKHLVRRKRSYKPGRYADQDGWYWHQMVDFEDSTDSTDSSHEESGSGDEGKDEEEWTDAPLGFLPGLGMFDGQGEKRNGRALSFGAESMSTGAPPVWATMKRRDSPQQQEGSAHSGPVYGEEQALDLGEDSEETDQEDVFYDAQESLASSADPGILPQQQEASAFTHFDPIGGEDFPSDGDEDGDEQAEQTEQLMETDQCDKLDGGQESLPSAHTNWSQQQLFPAQFDPFDFDEELEENEEFEETEQPVVFESGQESLPSSALLRFSSVPDYHWTMPESDK